MSFPRGLIDTFLVVPTRIPVKRQKDTNRITALFLCGHKVSMFVPLRSRECSSIARLTHYSHCSKAKLYWESERETIFGTSQYLYAWGRSFSWIIDDFPRWDKTRIRYTRAHQEEARMSNPRRGGRHGKEKAKVWWPTSLPQGVPPHSLQPGHGSAEGTQWRAEGGVPPSPTSLGPVSLSPLSHRLIITL